MKLSEIYKKGIENLKKRRLLFYLQGVETEFVLEHNEEIFKRFKFLQKAIGSKPASTETNLMGLRLKTPIIMSSVAMPIPQIAEDGLLQVAQGVSEAGSMMWTGSPLPKNLDELVRTGVPLVQTIKPYEDRRRIFQEIETAERAGVAAVGVEIDAGQGTKIRDQIMVSGCAPISVEELREIKEAVKRPLVLKGVLSPWDAEKSLEVGADLIVVSNHGAHTIDYLPHPLEVMDEIVKVVEGRIPIMVDGGFRRGTDVLKGLAFGAHAVGIVRPILYGLAAKGKEGVRGVLEQMTSELQRTMTMVGVRSPEEVTRDILL